MSTLRIDISNAQIYRQETQDLAKVTHSNPCPMLSALEAQGYLTPDAEGRISLKQLDKTFRDVLGMTLPMRAMFQLMAPTSTSVTKMMRNLFSREVDLGHLRGDFFDHRWDTGILEGGQFNKKAFDKLASYSGDGKTVTVEEWGLYMRDKLKSDRAAGKDVPGGPVGTLWEAGFVGFEAGLISSVLGKKDAKGELRMNLDDVRRLYENKSLPEGWEPGGHKTQLRTVMAGLAAAAFGLTFGSKAVGSADEGRKLALEQQTGALDNPLQGVMLACCPVGGKSGVSGVGKTEITDRGALGKVHDAISGGIDSPTTALQVAEQLNKTIDKGDAKATLQLLGGRSAESIERLKSAYAQRFGRDLEYDLRGFALDTKGPIDGAGFSLNLRGLKGAELKQALHLLHGPRLEKNAARIAELTSGAASSTPEGRREIYGMLSLAGGEERKMLADIFKARTGKNLTATLAPVFRAHSSDNPPLQSPPEKTVAIVVSSGNWKKMLDGKADQPLGGYHWREIEAYVKEAIDRGYTPVIFTPDGLPASPDQLSLLLGKLGPKLGFGLRPGTGPDSPQGKAILEGFLAPRSLTNFDATKFAALHVAGGHGSHQDLVKNPKVEAAATSLYERGGMVTAVCHASPSLGKLLQGGPATGFSPQIDSIMLKGGYVLPEFNPPYDAHQGLVDVGVPMSVFDRAQALANINHTETIKRSGKPPLFTGTGPEATDDVAKLAFDWLQKH